MAGCSLCWASRRLGRATVLRAYHCAGSLFDRAQMFYNWLAEDERADLCIECGECLEKCPQMIEIPEWLAKAHDVLCQEEAE